MTGRKVRGVGVGMGRRRRREDGREEEEGGGEDGGGGKGEGSCKVAPSNWAWV